MAQLPFDPSEVLRAQRTPEGSAPVPDSITVFEILMRECADSLLAFLRAATRDDATADDVFQETMLVAWRRLAEFDRTRSFGAWLRGIAKRTLMARRRSDARNLVMSNEAFAGVLDHLDAQIARIDEHPGDSFRERVAAIEDCVESLKDGHREIIRGFYSEQISTERLASRLDTTRDAIQKRLQRARAAIADCLARKGLLLRNGGSS